MNTGANIQRLRDSDVGPSLRACLFTGPADIQSWEVHVACDTGVTDGIPLEVVGRGPDLEAAAAEVQRELTNHSLAVFGQPEVSRTE